jgi:hypothetical protein
MEYAHFTGWAVESLQFCLTVDVDVATNCLQPLVGAVVATHPERVEDVLDVCAALPDGQTAHACWRSAGFGIHNSAESRPDVASLSRCREDKYCLEGLAEAERWTPNG